MTAPGWYPDPAGDPGLVRYHNGNHWTDETAPREVPASVDHAALLGLDLGTDPNPQPPAAQPPSAPAPAPGPAVPPAGGWAPVVGPAPGTPGGPHPGLAQPTSSPPVQPQPDAADGTGTSTWRTRLTPKNLRRAALGVTVVLALAIGIDQLREPELRLPELSEPEPGDLAGDPDPSEPTAPDQPSGSSIPPERLRLLLGQLTDPAEAASVVRDSGDAATAAGQAIRLQAFADTGLELEVSSELVPAGDGGLSATLSLIDPASGRIARAGPATFVEVEGQWVFDTWPDL